jgi:hypothetical protein
MTALGSKTEVSGLARHVRFTLRSRHRQPAPAGPFGANNGLSDAGIGACTRDSDIECPPTAKVLAVGGCHEVCRLGITPFLARAAHTLLLVSIMALERKGRGRPRPFERVYARC